MSVEDSQEQTEQEQECKRIQFVMPWALYEAGMHCALAERKSFSAWLRSAMSARIADCEGSSPEGLAACEMVNSMSPECRSMALDVLAAIRAVSAAQVDGD